MSCALWLPSSRGYFCVVTVVRPAKGSSRWSLPAFAGAISAEASRTGLRLPFQWRRFIRSDADIGRRSSRRPTSATLPQMTTRARTSGELVPQASSDATVVVTAIATPPNRGVGTAWRLLSFTSSSSARLRARRRTSSEPTTLARKHAHATVAVRSHTCGDDTGLATRRHLSSRTSVVFRIDWSASRVASPSATRVCGDERGPGSSRSPGRRVPPEEYGLPVSRRLR